MEFSVHANPVKSEVYIFLETRKIKKKILEEYPDLKSEDVAKMFVIQTSHAMAICEDCPEKRRKVTEEVKGGLFGLFKTLKIRREVACDGLERSAYNIEYIIAKWDESQVKKLSSDQINEKLNRVNCTQQDRN
jgi:hypothetical protein